MAVEDKKRRSADLAALAGRSCPKDAKSGPQARGSQRMMTAQERVRFFDDIRSRTKPTSEDSTAIIRRDRDRDDF